MSKLYTALPPMTLYEVVALFNKHHYLGHATWEIGNNACMIVAEKNNRDGVSVMASTALQIAARMQDPVPPINTLPGAERFYRYLCSIFPGKTVVVDAPIVLDWSYDMEYAKLYAIHVDGTQVGEYKTFGPKPGETDFVREFSGRLPNYRNEAALIYNQGRQESAHFDPRKISLNYGNKRLEEGDPPEYSHLVSTPFQRQDGHTDITQFP